MSNYTATSAASAAVFSARYRYLMVSALHLLLLAALTSALYAFGVIRVLPAATNLLQWDVMWYEQIRAGGYAYSATETSNAAFFPLLPYLWRFTGLGLLGMSLLNATLFLVSFTGLAQLLRLPARLHLLLLSTPVLLFMIVPYTEALFFFFGTLLLVGLRRRQLLWWVVGLLGCGLTRSASAVLTPGLLFMVVLWALQPGQLRTALTWGLTGLLALAAALGTVAFMQWKQTGEPWGFVLAQKHWGHHLTPVRFPLNDPSGVDMLWLDSAGLWLGAVAIAVCSWLAWRELMQLRQRQAPSAMPPEVVFALGYCVCAGLFVLLFQGGSIWNQSRYMLATPFSVVLAGQLAQQPSWPWHRYGLIAAATMGLWQVFGIYNHGFANFTTPEALWYFGLVTAYVLAYLAWRQLRWQREITMLLYVFNLVMLLHLLECWLQGYVVQ